MPEPQNQAYFAADWNLYKQSLFHLVVNALKFSKPKIQTDPSAATVIISLNLRKEKDDGTSQYKFILETRVLDSGIGIPDKLLKSLNRSSTGANIARIGPN